MYYIALTVNYIRYIDLIRYQGSKLIIIFDIRVVYINYRQFTLIDKDDFTKKHILVIIQLDQISSY